MKQSIRTLLILLAVSALSLGGLTGCKTEYDYAKSDAGKYERPYTDGRDKQSDDDSADDEESDSQ
ncbi:MAG: hypothetical protein AAGB27_07000 [Pseudomonadota bacterium]